jgi:HNH endonuclease
VGHGHGEESDQDYGPDEQCGTDVAEYEPGKRHSIARLTGQANLTSCHMAADDRRNEGDADSELSDAAHQRRYGQVVGRSRGRVRVIALHARLRGISHRQSTSSLVGRCEDSTRSAPRATGTPASWEKGSYVFEHIVVMERLLGRHLLPDESVHHLNGVRDDNRPENLELWTRPQPTGIRARDAVAWAREILARYDELDKQNAPSG